MLLDISQLFVEFHTIDGTVYAVNGIDLSLAQGASLGIIGESGSGKSVSTHAITRLLPMPPAKIPVGSIKFNGVELLNLPENQLNKIRGRKIAMIFQEPMTSLNPVYTIENQMAEVLQIHFPEIPSQQWFSRLVESLNAVGIPAPERVLSSYPYQLSGGMRQRVMIAMALLGEPELLIADEPTTALDVTIQAQVLSILKRLQQQKQMSIILITHDFGVIAEVAEFVAVMYAGRIIEYASVKAVLQQPQHPYTVGLLQSIPAYQEKNRESNSDQPKKLYTIPGMIPDLRIPAVGCPFAPRCPLVTPQCWQDIPALLPSKEFGENHKVACFLRS